MSKNSKQEFWLEPSLEELVLLESDETYRSLFNNMLNGIAFCKMLFDEGKPYDYINLKVNDAFVTLTGLKGIEGKKISEVIPGIRENDSELFNIYARVSQTGQPERFEIFVDSLQMWFLISVYSPKQEYFVVIFDAITERKKAEAILRESEARYARVLEGSDQSFWDWNLVTQEFKVSPRFESMLGYSPGEMIVSPEHWIQHIHREDLAKAWESIEMHCQGLTPSHEVEVRCRAKSREWKWILTRGRIVNRSEGGEPLIMSGTFTDISERKKTEEELQLASLVYQVSSEAMTVTDENDTILAINSAFTKLTGYAPDEVIGKNPRILKSGHHGKDFYEAMWKALNTTGQWQGEIWNRRKNGEIYPEWLSINSTFNKDGSVHRRVALFSDITKKKELEELLWKQANIDLLTGLPNRHMFMDRLDQEIKKANQSGALMALLFLDLDYFKDINDTLGHIMGDMLLKVAAERLRSCVRNMDTVARLGGDEFTVLLSELQNGSDAERVVNEILHRLSMPYHLGDEVAYISASIGITVYPVDAINPEDLLKSADQAMYAAKREGRNRYHYFTPSMQQAAQERMRLINDMRGALSGNQFRVHYQPIVELATGSIHKAEALIRWQHPVRGLISPAEFIPLAEETGTIVDIGDWMFKEAARQVKRMRELHEPRFQISVNTSPVQFRKDSTLHEAWFDYLRELSLPGDSMVIEITESLLMDTSALVTNRLNAFRSAGIQVSLDDFGTGYSSLSYLKKFNLDYLKIDKSFVRNLTAESDDFVLCEAIIVMAHKLGIKVIAEGIETNEQRDLLAKAGCDYAQGYLFSRPVSADEFEELLKADSFHHKKC